MDTTLEVDVDCDSGCDKGVGSTHDDQDEVGDDVFTFDNIADIIGFATRRSPRRRSSPTRSGRRERPTTVKISFMIYLL